MLNTKDKDSSCYVNMSNALIKAAHGLTITEKRLLMLAVSKLDSKAINQADMIVRIAASEFSKLYGLAPNTGYEEVKQASERLMDRRIRFFHGHFETRMQWVGRATYAPTEGITELALWHELAPMLFELKSHFTSYRLNRASGLKSVYSWRLFELLMQFKKTGLLNISIDDFSKSLELSETYTKDFGAMRRKVIEPAVKEIREKDGLLVEWEAIKAGRKVKALKFTFPTEQQLKLDTEPKSEPSAKRATTPAPASLKAEPSVLSLAEIKSRLESARALAALANTSIETYLTERDRTAIKHHQLTI